MVEGKIESKDRALADLPVGKEDRAIFETETCAPCLRLGEPVPARPHDFFRNDDGIAHIRVEIALRNHGGPSFRMRKLETAGVILKASLGKATSLNAWLNLTSM